MSSPSDSSTTLFHIIMHCTQVCSFPVHHIHPRRVWGLLTLVLVLVMRCISRRDANHVLLLGQGWAGEALPPSCAVRCPMGCTRS